MPLNKETRLNTSEANFQFMKRRTDRQRCIDRYGPTGIYIYIYIYIYKLKSERLRASFKFV